MKFEYFKLNRDRQIVKRMTINLDDYVAILATGHNWKLMRSKGRPLELYSMNTFDDFSMIQRQNDEAVERRTFSYIYNSDGRKISDRVRDEKGRPLKEYTKQEDILSKAIKLNYIEGKELFKYSREKGIFFYDDDPWRETLKDREAVVKCECFIEPNKAIKKLSEQEKEDQFFEERGNMYVGEKTPLWIKIGAILLIPFNLSLWWKYMFKKS